MAKLMHNLLRSQKKTQLNIFVPYIHAIKKKTSASFILKGEKFTHFSCCLGVQVVDDKNPLVGLSQAVQLRMCSTHWGTLLGGFGQNFTGFTGRLVDMRNTKPSKMNGWNMSSLMEVCFQIIFMFLSKCDGCRML